MVQSLLITLRRDLAEAGRRWRRHEAARLAAGLAFYAAFSLAPLTLAVVALLGALVGRSAAPGLVGEVMGRVLGPERADALQGVLAQAQKPRAGGAAGLLAFAVVLWGASSVVRELQASLNLIFGARPSGRAWVDWLRRRLVALGFVGGVGLLLLASLALGAALAAASRLLGGTVADSETALHALNGLVSFALASCLFACMFRFLPDARPAWRDVAGGGAFTGLLFTAGNLVLGLYLGKVASATAYGAAGSLAALLLWTYYCAQILYFGAEFTEARAVRAGRSRHRAAS